MIYTFTLNPAVDYYIELHDALIEDEVNRGSNEIYKAGGKGLNVSKILDLFETDHYAAALLGGFTGSYIANIFKSYAHIHLISVPVNGTNRINVKAAHGAHSLVINGNGPLADDKTREELRKIAENTQKGDTAILAGSMMRGLDQSFLIDLCGIFHQQHVQVIMDMELKDVKIVEACRPALIKPNIYELRLLMHDDTIREENLYEKVQPLCQCGIEDILVSEGADGAVLINSESILKLDQPHNLSVNKAGAGDAMLAAWIAARKAGKSRAEALCYSGAAGNAAASKVEDITMDDIRKYLPCMSVHSLMHC